MAKSIQTPRQIRKVPNTDYKKRLTNMFAKAAHYTVVGDPESTASNKFIIAPQSIIRTELPIIMPKTYHIRNDHYRVCKNGVTPSFSDLTDESRTMILAVIKSSGNLASRLLYDLTGMIAKQVGQIRRNHVPEWREQQPNRLFNFI